MLDFILHHPIPKLLVILCKAISLAQRKILSPHVLIIYLLDYKIINTLKSNTFLHQTEIQWAFYVCFICFLSSLQTIQVPGTVPFLTWSCQCFMLLEIYKLWLERSSFAVYNNSCFSGGYHNMNDWVASATYIYFLPVWETEECQAKMLRANQLAVGFSSCLIFTPSASTRLVLHCLPTSERGWDPLPSCSTSPQTLSLHFSLLPHSFPPIICPVNPIWIYCYWVLIIL